MATNILLNKAYDGQEVVYSSEISEVSNIDFSAILSEGSTGQIQYTVQRKTANSAWRDAVDDRGGKLQFKTVNAAADGINIVSLNAYKCRLKVEILSGEGTLNIEYESL